VILKKIKALNLNSRLLFFLKSQIILCN